MLFVVNLIMFYTAYCVQDVDSYIHRSGRTGRAGRPGISVVLYQSSEMNDLGTVERVAVSSCTDAKLLTSVRMSWLTPMIIWHGAYYIMTLFLYVSDFRCQQNCVYLQICAQSLWCYFELLKVKKVKGQHLYTTTYMNMASSGILTGNDTRWRSASNGSPLPERTDFGLRSLQL